MITGIDFFVESSLGGTLYSGTYQISFSTISANITSLSDTNFSSNLGPDDTTFDTVTLSGAAPNELTFTGNPFSYNPANGNLLLDIEITNGGPENVTSFFEKDNGSGGAIARYHNFGNGTTGGLVTEFDYTTTTPEPGTLALLACGLVGLLAPRLRRSRS